MLIAAIAIAAALVLMLAPQAHSGNASSWLAVLPVLFIGVVAPLRVLPAPECFDAVRASDAPALQPFFQRPPPLQLA